LGFAVGDLLDHLIGGEILDDFFGIHAQGAEWSQSGIESRVVNFFGMELEIDPFINAQLRDEFDIAGPRAESEAIQGMEGTFGLIERWGGGFILFAGQGELGRDCGSQK
jgi:hypothetical protein